LAPGADQELVARADDVIGRDGDVLYRREGGRCALEEVVAVELQRLAGRLRDEVLEVVAVYALRLGGAGGFFGARGRLGRGAALRRGLVRYGRCLDRRDGNRCGRGGRCRGGGGSARFLGGEGRAQRDARDQPGGLAAAASRK